MRPHMSKAYNIDPQSNILIAIRLGNTSDPCRLNISAKLANFSLFCKSSPPYLSFVAEKQEN